MRIREIKTESTAEVKGQVADVIYFQGEGGKLMHLNEVLNSLSALSSAVVLGGGEPSLQYEEVKELIGKIEDKKIILETGTFNRDLHHICDKVVFIFNTEDLVHENVITHIQNHLDKYIPLIVIGREQFNPENFAKLCKILDKIYVRSRDGNKLDASTQSQIADKYKTKLIELDKIPL